MTFVLGEPISSAVAGWLMLALVVLLFAGLLAGWLLGRMLGPRSAWRREIERRRGQRRRPGTDVADAWTESARRFHVEDDEAEADDDDAPPPDDQTPPDGDKPDSGR